MELINRMHDFLIHLNSNANELDAGEVNRHLTRLHLIDNMLNILHSNLTSLLNDAKDIILNTNGDSEVSSRFDNICTKFNETKFVYNELK